MESCGVVAHYLWQLNGFYSLCLSCGVVAHYLWRGGKICLSPYLYHLMWCCYLFLFLHPICKALNSLSFSGRTCVSASCAVRTVPEASGIPHTHWTLLLLKNHLVYCLSHSCGMRTYGVFQLFDLSALNDSLIWVIGVLRTVGRSFLLSSVVVIMAFTPMDTNVSLKR